MKLFLSLFVAIFLGACSVLDNDTSAPLVNFSSSEIEDMLLVTTLHGNTALGTNDTLSKADERPKMVVKLDYQFYIGKHEVTCGKFNATMLGATGLTVACQNPKYPVTDVTYYDAVLFANELSKSAGLDTAYTYAKIVF